MGYIARMNDTINLYIFFKSTVATHGITYNEISLEKEQDSSTPNHRVALELVQLQIVEWRLKNKSSDVYHAYKCFMHFNEM